MDGDNAEVVNVLNEREISLVSVGLLIEDTKLEVDNFFTSISFLHVRRTGNEVTHDLAKNARYVDDIVIWLEEIHDCVRV